MHIHNVSAFPKYAKILTVVLFGMTLNCYAVAHALQSPPLTSEDNTPVTNARTALHCYSVAHVLQSPPGLGQDDTPVVQS